MIEFGFSPTKTTTKSGSVTINALNSGKTVHELVVLKTDADPATLPKKGGKVDEAKKVGEIADVNPGATRRRR